METSISSKQFLSSDINNKKKVKFILFVINILIVVNKLLFNVRFVLILLLSYLILIVVVLWQYVKLVLIKLLKLKNVLVVEKIL
jgi:hypothetical protein